MFGPQTSTTGASTAAAKAYSGGILADLFGTHTSSGIANAAPASRTSGGNMADLSSSSIGAATAPPATTQGSAQTSSMLPQAVRESIQQAKAKAEQAYRESTQQAGAKSEQAYRESTQQAGAKSEQAYRESTQQAGAKSEQAYRESTQHAGAKSAQAYRESTQHAGAKLAEAGQKSVEVQSQPAKGYQETTHRTNPQHVQAQTTQNAIQSGQQALAHTVPQLSGSLNDPTHLSGTSYTKPTINALEATGSQQGESHSSIRSTAAASLLGGPQQAVLGHGSSNARGSASEKANTNIDTDVQASRTTQHGGPSSATLQNSASSASASAVPLWGNCGGSNPGKCAEGTTCVYQDQWYSQCKPNSASGDSQSAGPSQSQSQASLGHSSASYQTSATQSNTRTEQSSNTQSSSYSQQKTSAQSQSSTSGTANAQSTSSTQSTTGSSQTSSAISASSTHSTSSTQSSSRTSQSSSKQTTPSTASSTQRTSTTTGSSSTSTASVIPMWSPCGGSSNGVCAPGSSCICKDQSYSQCRPQVGGSWAQDSSWQCQSPGQKPSSSGGASQTSGKYTPSRYQSSGSATGSQSGSQTGSQTGSHTSSQTGSQTGTKTSAGSSSGTSSASATSSAILNNKYMGRNATQGNCTNTKQTDGWHGVGATSRYGWMGSACQCGDKGATLGSAPWQADSSRITGGVPKGFYSGAVNQQLFNGKINKDNQPNCGSACGSCYQLQTTGSNTYGPKDAPNGGSTINMMVVDACYNPSDSNKWCQSSQKGVSDPHGCEVHFDIQTGPDDSKAPNPQGADGAKWAGAGDVIQYRSIPCPDTASNQYHKSCGSCG